LIGLLPLAAIAAQANVHIGLIKYYFGNKGGLLLALFEHDAARVLKAIRQSPDQTDADDGLEAQLAAVVRACADRPYLPRLITMLKADASDERVEAIDAMLIDPMMGSLREILQQGAANGVFRPVDPMFLQTVMFGALDQMFADHRVRFVDDLVDLLLNGVRGNS
jgi:TetR/AcrR family transcriptional regulator